MSRKNINLRIVIENAKALSDPIISDCFFYGECEGVWEVVSEIDAVRESLPEGLDLCDLPHVYCGNRKTKIYGVATCTLTEGHRILKEDAPNRVIFSAKEEAEKKGYRPCKWCIG